MKALIDIANHKGVWCKEKSVFCQEGYCANCQIKRETVCEQCGQYETDCTCEEK